MDIIDTIAMWIGYAVAVPVIIYLAMDQHWRIHLACCHVLAEMRANRFLVAGVRYWLVPRALWRNYRESYRPWTRGNVTWTHEGKRVSWEPPSHVWSIGSIDFHKEAP